MTGQSERTTDQNRKSPSTAYIAWVVGALGLGFGFAYTVGLILGGLWHDRKGFGLMPAVLTLTVTPVAIVAYVSPVASTAVAATIAASFLEAFAVGRPTRPCTIAFRRICAPLRSPSCCC